MNDEIPESEGKEAPRQPNKPSRCGRCGTIGYTSDHFCPCCGAEMIRRCGSCGAPVRHPVASYCTTCGAALDEPEESG
jgi:hypothetical protein